MNQSIINTRDVDITLRRVDTCISKRKEYRAS